MTHRLINCVSLVNLSLVSLIYWVPVNEPKISRGETSFPPLQFQLSLIQKKKKKKESERESYVPLVLWGNAEQKIHLTMLRSLDRGVKIKVGRPTKQ